MLPYSSASKINPFEKIAFEKGENFGKISVFFLKNYPILVFI